MRAGIMQPYFFPYLGHFALVQHSDAWVVFDVTQYTPKTWMNRNRVLHPAGSWNWITVPLANSGRSIRISEARVLDGIKARNSAIGKLSHYRRKAPFWRMVEDLVSAAFDGAADDSLVALNVSALSVVCRYLGIQFEPLICSQLGIDFSGVTHPGGWAPVAAAAIGANRYLNPIGGHALFSEADFIERGLSLEFLEFPMFEYDSSPFTFQPGLSIIDVLMWNDVSAVCSALSEAVVVHPSELPLSRPADH
jgi:hypothetical protein